MSSNRHELNLQLTQMLKGGVMMDVTNTEQAGAVAVMASGKSSLRHTQR